MSLFGRREIALLERERELYVSENAYLRSEVKRLTNLLVERDAPGVVARVDPAPRPQRQSKPDPLAGLTPVQRVLLADAEKRAGSDEPLPPL